MRILNSIDGRIVGVGHARTDGTPGPLISVGGAKLGEHGAQTDLPWGRRVAWFEDFLGDVIPDQINAIEGTDSATSACAILAGGIGGVMRLTTGDAGTGWAADAEEIVTALQWQASNGNLVCEVRAKLSAIATCYAFIGFTDDATNLEQPILFATGTTFTTNATDAVGFLFDTTATSKNWWLTGVATNVDATMQDTGIAPVADTYQVFRIEVSSAGVATFYINGIQVGTTMTGAVAPAADLTPVIAVSKLSVAASMTMDVDYWHVAMDRLAPGTAT